MKNLLGLYLAFFTFALIGCGEGRQVKFASYGQPEEVIVYPSAENDVVEVIDNESVADYEQERVEFVEDQTEIRIGRKSGKRTPSSEKTIEVVTQPEEKTFHIKVQKPVVATVVTQPDEVTILPVKNSQVDMLFYVGSELADTDNIADYFKGKFKRCLHNFAKQTYENDLLGRLDGLDWQFAQTNFSDSSRSAARPYLLELSGHYVKRMNEETGRVEKLSVLDKSVYKFKEIFAHSLAPLSGGSTYHFGPFGFEGKPNRVVLPRQDVLYDSPQPTYVDGDGMINPLPGLDDILTNRPSDVIRDGSRVEVFVATNHFGNYSDDVVKGFLKKHKDARIHLLYSPVNERTDYGSLSQIVDATGGYKLSLCKEKDITSELVNILD